MSDWPEEARLFTYRKEIKIGIYGGDGSVAADNRPVSSWRFLRSGLLFITAASFFRLHGGAKRIGKRAVRILEKIKPA